MKKILIISGVVLLVFLVAAGSFWGGMTYQTNQASQALVRFESVRGQLPEGFTPGEGREFTGGNLPEGVPAGNLTGRGTTGQIKSLDGDVLTISTALDVTTVNLTEDTRIEMTVEGELANLEPGVRVFITGQPGENGVITAERIQILSENMLMMPEMQQSEQGP